MSYVGLTGAVALARDGHDVIGIENDSRRLTLLQSYTTPVYEPHLQEALSSDSVRRNLRFRSDLQASAREDHVYDTIVITVGTPRGDGERADLSQVLNALGQVERSRSCWSSSIVLKSTVPPGTCESLMLKFPGLAGRFFYNPDFLNQGRALDQWAHPDRVIIGTGRGEEAGRLDSVVAMYTSTAPLYKMTWTSAELVKYASNYFIALKISFSNEIANLCESVDSNVDEVLRGVGADDRIRPDMFRPGIGFGDSCLPKDTRALRSVAAERSVEMRILNAVIGVNEAQRGKPLEILRRILAGDPKQHVVSVLGVRNESNSDDIREAAIWKVLPSLRDAGFEVRVWEPLEGARMDTSEILETAVFTDLEKVLQGASAALVLCDWPLLKVVDWACLSSGMNEPRLVLDCINHLNPRDFKGSEINYIGIGRTSASTATP